MMVAAITAMPPPCGVGTVCDERAFGLASAMRCSQRPDRDDDRDADRERDDESGCRRPRPPSSSQHGSCIRSMPSRLARYTVQIFLAHTATINPRLSRKVCR